MSELTVFAASRFLNPKMNIPLRKDDCPEDQGAQLKE
jgi:hypothetical protein